MLPPVVHSTDGPPPPPFFVKQHADPDVQRMGSPLSSPHHTLLAAVVPPELELVDAPPEDDVEEVEPPDEVDEVDPEDVDEVEPPEDVDPPEDVAPLLPLELLAPEDELAVGSVPFESVPTPDAGVPNKSLSFAPPHAARRATDEATHATKSRLGFIGVHED